MRAEEHADLVRKYKKRDIVFMSREVVRNGQHLVLALGVLLKKVLNEHGVRSLPADKLCNFVRIITLQKSDYAIHLIFEFGV